LGGLMAVARRHQLVRSEVDRLHTGDGADLRLRAYQDWNDEPGPRSVDGTEQRVPIDGMDDGRAERLPAPSQLEDVAMAQFRVTHARRRNDAAWRRALRRRRGDLQASLDDY